jgi:hypothetical protein
MNETPRRRSGWKLWAGVCAAFGLPLLGLTLWISSAADRRWEEMLADGRLLVDEAKRRDGTREVLRGEPIPGRAWDDYVAADALLKAAGVLSEVDGFVAQKPGVDRAKVLADLEKYTSAVELFRKGARRTDGQYPWDWSRFPEQAMVSLSQSMRLADFVLAQARVDSESGRARLGAEVALDVVRFWQDCSFNVIPLGTAISIAGARRGLDLIRWELMKGMLKPEDLPDLERQLEVLDRTMPTFGPTLKNNQAYMAHLLGEVSAFDSAGYLGGPRWRYGFSPRLQVSAWYSQLSRDTERLVDCDRMSWAEETAAWARFESDRTVTQTNPALATAVVFKSFSSNLRQLRARLRLLRLALHRRTTGAWLDLEDPYGGRLRHEETETLLRVWSLGADAVDHQGQGTWECSDRRNLVLEVPK